MYNNLDEKLKKLAIAIFIIELAACIIFFLYTLLFASYFAWWGILTIIAGPFVALISSWPVYALGEVIEQNNSLSLRLYEIEKQLKKDNNN